MNRTTLARSLAVMATATATAVITGGGAVKGGYSHVSNFISELTAVGSPFAETIALYGFLPIAVLLAAFLVVAAPLVPVRGASRAGYWLLLTQPVAYISVAVVPCDLGCPAEGSITQGLHNLFGVVTYFGAAVGLVLMSRAPSLSKSASTGFVIAGVLWLAVFVLMLEPALAPWRGFLQRVAEAILWGVVLFIAWRMLPQGGPGAIEDAARQ